MPRRPSPEVDEFVAARFPALLRTAYLLVGDPAGAEDLLQVALADVATSWRRSELGPELTARRAMVRARAQWWRGRRRPGARDDGEELLAALDRLPRRQRAALVLREHDRLADEEVAAALECPTAAAVHLAERARSRLGAPDPRAALAGLADTLAVGDPDAVRLTVADRLEDVAHRADVRRAWRRTEVVTSLFVATAAAVTVAAVFPSPRPRPGLDTPQPALLDPPPRVAGHQLPPVLPVNDVGYQYFRSSQSFPGRTRLRVAVAAELKPQAVAWLSSPGTPGVVRVTVDGKRVGQTPGGAFDSGVLLSAGRQHTVTVTATNRNPSMRLGLAVYAWPLP